MRTVHSFVLGMILLAISSTCADAQEAKKIDMEKLYGEWEYVSGRRAGEDVAEERLVGTVKISKEAFEIPGGPEGNFVMSYTVDSDKTPAQIDFNIESGPIPEGQAKGLIKFDGTTLWLCYEPMGGARPEKMESTTDNQAHLFELKRKEAS